MLFFRLISRLPLAVLYLFSDGVYLVVRYLIRYRQKVIDQNLLHAFPERTDAERKKIRNRFYRNFTDTLAETIKLLTLSVEELRSRFPVTHLEEVDQVIQSGRSAVLLAGHLFNWEMGALSTTEMSGSDMETVYLKLNNPFFDQLMLKIRSRFGATLTEKRVFRKTMISLRSQHRVVNLAADQRPASKENRYQRPFLNRPAYFFEGAEFIGKKLQLPVFYAKVSKIKRGYYQLEIVPLASPPYEAAAAHQITDAFCEALEENIRAQPDLYLWSHKRWKV